MCCSKFEAKDLTSPPEMTISDSFGTAKQQTEAVCPLSLHWRAAGIDAGYSERHSSPRPVACTFRNELPDSPRKLCRIVAGGALSVIRL